MPHQTIISEHSVFWDHLEFFGRRVDRERSSVGYNYGRFESEEAADSYPETKPDLLSGRFGAEGPLVEQFFWDEAANGGAGGFAMDDARNFAFLKRLLSEPFTAEELESTFGIKEARRRMSGLEFTVAGTVVFTVSELEAISE